MHVMMLEKDLKLFLINYIKIKKIKQNNEQLTCCCLYNANCIKLFLINYLKIKKIKQNIEQLTICCLYNEIVLNYF
jgi:hypothetical protein